MKDYRIPVPEKKCDTTLNELIRTGRGAEIDELLRVSDLYSHMDDRYLRGIAAGINIALEAILKQENAPQPTKAMRDMEK